MPQSWHLVTDTCNPWLMSKLWFNLPSASHVWLPACNILMSSRSTIFWDITPCSPLKANRRFGGTYSLHLQARMSRARFQRKNSTCLHLTRLIRPWRWRRYAPPERRLNSNGLHGVISQRIVLFITTAVKVSVRTMISSFGKITRVIIDYSVEWDMEKS
jgi:hypothetical protein